MKQLSILGTSCFLFFTFLIACSPAEKKDSADLAQVKNVENFGTRDGEKDANFIVKTVEDSYAEIKLAQLAANKSSDANVKGIAVMLEKDNSTVLNELKDLSYKKGIAIPVEESTKAKNDIQALQKEEQNEFNKDWLKKIKEHHESTIKNFESTREKTKDVELISWINMTLPRIRSYQDSIHVYQNILKASR